MILALLPGYSLRIHHYILALVILPGTAFPTRLSAIYQGLMLGLLLNGIAAFGWDPVVQTAAEVCVFDYFWALPDIFYSCDRMRC